MVFNPEIPGKRIVLPRIDLKTEDPSRNGESETPAKPPKKSTIPLRVDDTNKNKSQQQQQQQKSKGGLEHTFRGEREVFLNKGLTSGAQLGRDRKGAEYSYRIENFFHNVGSDIFDTPSTDETQLKKSPSDSDFFSKAAARCGEEKFNELLRDGVEKLNTTRNDEALRSKMKERGEGVPSKISEKPSGIPTYNNNNNSNNNNSSNNSNSNSNNSSSNNNNSSNNNSSKNGSDNKNNSNNNKRNNVNNKDLEANKETGVDKKMKIESAESDAENAKEVGDEKGLDINELELKLPENFLTGDLASKGLEHDFKLKRLWRDMLKWKGISQEREDIEKRKAVNFEEFHAVLEFLKY